MKIVNSRPRLQHQLTLFWPPLSDFSVGGPPLSKHAIHVDFEHLLHLTWELIAKEQRQCKVSQGR